MHKAKDEVAGFRAVDEALYAPQGHLFVDGDCNVAHVNDSLRPDCSDLRLTALGLGCLLLLLQNIILVDLYE